MKKQLSWHELVIILSMLTMPIAAAINFGAAAYDMLLPRVGATMAAAGGVSTGIGFETLGIMAGHYAIAYYGKKDKRWLVAAIIMVAYVAVGTVELWHVPLARFVPLLGAMVYILAGLGQELTATNQQQQSRAQFDLEQEAADKELARKLKAANAKMKHEEKLARITQTKKGTNNQTVTDTFKTDWRTFTDSEKARMVDFTPDEIVTMYNVSRKTAGRWLERAGQMSANGVVK